MDTEQSQILLALGKIEGQISGFLRDIANANEAKADHEQRIRSLETNQSKQSGVFIGATAVATAVASVIAFAAQHFFG